MHKKRSKLPVPRIKRHFLEDEPGQFSIRQEYIYTKSSKEPQRFLERSVTPDFESHKSARSKNSANLRKASRTLNSSPLTTLTNESVKDSSSSLDEDEQAIWRIIREKQDFSPFSLSETDLSASNKYLKETHLNSKSPPDSSGETKETPRQSTPNSLLKYISQSGLPVLKEINSEDSSSDSPNASISVKELQLGLNEIIDNKEKQNKSNEDAKRELKKSILKYFRRTKSCLKKERMVNSFQSTQLTTPESSLTSCDFKDSVEYLKRR